MHDSINGRDLDPQAKSREMFAIKASRQSVHVSYNPSTIDQNETLRIRMPYLGTHNAIVPGLLKVGFDLELTSTKTDRYIVNNLGRSIIDKIEISFEGENVQAISDYDIWNLYQDLWLSYGYSVDH